ncbi:MAG: hypothetical protein HY900_30590 [Deltaproteobacteria bacterium]|nr:hypothetical protein [Deltaproteobacteria bacterium]
MKRALRAIVLVALGLAWASASFGEAPVVKAGDSIQKVLEGHQGKKVTVRLLAGEELTGKVKTVTNELLHLSGLTGREYFDAVVDVNRVQAVIVRVHE